MNFLHKYKVFPVVLMALLLGGCSKSFLDQRPTTSVAAPDAFNTPADMQAALTGAYAQLLYIYGESMMIVGDLLGDNTFVSVAGSGVFNQFNGYNFTANVAYTNTIWLGAYRAILAANNIIDAPLQGGDVVAQYKGEAYAIRALAYFNLVRLYGKAYTVDSTAPGVPLTLHYNPNALPARNTVAEVYRQIIADFNTAYSLMNTYNGTATFSKYAALALGAKAELYRGNYTAAYDKAVKVINESGFTLVPLNGVSAYWAATAAQDNSSQRETLFEVASTAINYGPVGELAFSYVQSASASGELLTRKSLYDLYNATDVRKSLILVGARNRPGGENPAWFVNKYTATSGDLNDKKVIRLSDVYLIAAEAALRNTKTGDAQMYLNTLVKQRDPSLNYTQTGDALLTAIITERRKELAFEGDRFFDLNRLNLEINRTPEYSSGNIAPGDPRRLMPIPQNEINANPNIAPN